MIDWGEVIRSVEIFRDKMFSALNGKGERTMIDREKVIGHLYDCLAASRPENMWVFVRKDIIGDSIALLKEQEEQKQKWLKQIEDAQLAVCPTGIETEEGLAKRTGKWLGLQMAWDILTKGR